jgi:hypothetical protein
LINIPGPQRQKALIGTADFAKNFSPLLMSAGAVLAKSHGSVDKRLSFLRQPCESGRGITVAVRVPGKVTKNAALPVYALAGVYFIRVQAQSGCHARHLRRLDAPIPPDDLIGDSVILRATDAVDE